MKKQKAALCHCGSQVLLEDCCFPIIKGRIKAKNAEQLMRSRYTAYVLLDDAYILRSWHPSKRPNQIELDSSVLWTGLQVVKVTALKKKKAFADATVEFIARFSQQGSTGEMHELSQFKHEDGHWYYIDGEQLNGYAAPVKQGRNEVCICGSGKKFKKCCALKL